MPFASALVATERPSSLARRLVSGLGRQAAVTARTSADGRTVIELADGGCVIVPHGHWLELNATAADANGLAAVEEAVTVELLLSAAETGDDAGAAGEGGPRVEWTPAATADVAFEPLHPAVADYALAHSTAPDDILSELAVETRESAGGAATMQISHDEGTLLTMLVRLAGARNAVEVGTFTGYSAICIARGLAPGGRLLACDVSEKWTAIARRYWAKAEVADRIDLKIAPALDTLRGLPEEEAIDFAFIDADKETYPEYYAELVRRLRPGGLIVLDNVLRGGRVLDPAAQQDQIVILRRLNAEVAADERVDAVMLPLRDGVTVVRKR